MDFSLSPQIEQYRRELKDIIARVITPEAVEEQHRSGTFNNDALNLALAEGGYLVKDPTKPRALQVRYEPSSGTARVRIPATSEPATASERPKPARNSPVAMPGR